ncbi:MAG: hypothetical protein L6R39_001496 [Caloplaca ligustica]|nr:MAG: hypothetical protein L6R39_001496 [Caloplaca ligustica]
MGGVIPLDMREPYWSRNAEEPHYGCKDMAWGCVLWPFLKNAKRKAKADEDRWRNSYPVWAPCGIMIPFGWLFRGREWPTCRKSPSRRRWETLQRRWALERDRDPQANSSKEQTKYPEPRISPCSLRPRQDEDTISDLDLNLGMSLKKSIMHRLPLEIRQEIYAYVLGTQRNLLILLPFKIRAVPDEGWVSGHPLDADINGRLINCEELRFWPQRTALLRTCRQVYVEAAELLYTRSTFVIKHPHILPRFAQSIPAKRFNSIRHLCVTISLRRCGPSSAYRPGPGRYIEEWNHLWETAAGIQHLQTLELTLRECVFRHSPDLDYPIYRAVLEPLLKIRGLRSFHIQFTKLGAHDFESCPEHTEVLPESAQSLIRCIKAAVRMPRKEQELEVETITEASW